MQTKKSTSCNNPLMDLENLGNMVWIHSACLGMDGRWYLCYSSGFSMSASFCSSGYPSNLFSHAKDDSRANYEISIPSLRKLMEIFLNTCKLAILSHR